MAVSAENVTDAYRILLGRDPENSDAIAAHRHSESTIKLVEAIVGSDEFVRRMRNQFFNYSACFDAVGTMKRHEDHSVSAESLFFKNFLGVRIRESYLPHILKGKAGTVEAVPIPANWHADIAEWAAVLRAVDLAKDDFAVVELGCGWGCWLNNAGIAARRAGLKVTQIGIEGDEGHVRMAEDAGSINGFGDRYKVHHGLAAGRSGTALFPLQPKSGIDWGLAPILDATDDFTRRALKARTHAALPLLSIDDLADGLSKIDLLHIDIQGGEADLIDETLDVINRKVAYIFVGSHSREIEGRLRASLLNAGWKLEIDRPAIFDLSNDRPHLLVDGAMGWRNPRLASA